MQWSGDRNAEAIVGFLERASAEGAEVCVFPELSIPGFHRQIREQAKPDLLAARLETVQAACARRGIGAVLGAPTFDAQGQIFNSALFLDASGSLHSTVEKTGLTAPEATFFVQGVERPVVDLFGHRCSAILCREVEDLEPVCAQFAENRPTLLFWPGLMGPEEGTEHLEPPRHVRQAQEMARRLRAHIVQANWPNSLNYPEKSSTAGRSVVVSPSGNVEFTLPAAEAGLGIFNLGDEAGSEKDFEISGRKVRELRVVTEIAT
jgi:predicted amidohydrolase